MPKHLSDFYNKVKEDGLHFGYQFEVSLTSGEAGAELDGLEDLKFFANSTTLPAKSLGQAEVKYYGMTFRLPGVTTYEGTLTMEVKCDSNFVIRTAIEDWMQKYSALDLAGGGDKRMPDYGMRIDLLSHDLQDVLATYKLVGVFPNSVGEVILDHSQADAVSIFSLGITYQYWYLEEAKGKSEPTQPRKITVPGNFKDPLQTSSN
jgi:hypothetical protein